MTQHEVNFDAAAHSVDAIQRAMYKLSDRLSGDLSFREGTYQCTLYFTADDENAVQAVLADFRNEVLDQTLRERIRSETAEARNLILALAFSNTGLIDPTDP